MHLRRVGPVALATLFALGCGTSERPAPSGGLGNLSGGRGDQSDSASAPPPISGGTLLVTRDGTRAFASDPDRARIVIVDLPSRRVVEEVPLDEGDQPGRAAEDAAGRVHVLLRNGNGYVTLDRDGKRLDARKVCAGPRGIDYDAGRDQLVIACVTGALTRVGADPSAPIVSRVDLGPDLRDVVVAGDHTFVSRFRSAEVMLLDADDRIVETARPPVENGTMFPSVAWRMTPTPEGGVYLVHQRSSSAEIVVDASAPPDAYGNPQQGAGPVVEAGGTTLDANGEIVETHATPGAVLPVDGAVSESGEKVFVAASSDLLLDADETTPSPFAQMEIPGEPIAVRFVGDEVLVQTREPSSLFVISRDGAVEGIGLGGGTARDPGHTAFHRTPDGPTLSISCASCHPEGRDDGRVWSFVPSGPRRTQSLLGDVTATSPFHWDGDMPDLGSLLSEVFTHRMGNRELTSPEKRAFEAWLSTLEDLPADDASSTTEKGRKAFESAGCAACHDGERLTNLTSADVGTGAKFQVPSLIGLRYRAPYLHDGCASTIEERFGPCGGDAHGTFDELPSEDRAALIDYLKSL